jgi:hypothetical protein
MDFFRKHYEKLLLGLVLVGLVGALGYLPFKISNEKDKLTQMSEGLTAPKVKPLSYVDLTIPESSVKRASVPVSYDFASSNKLFNPMPWQRASDGHLLRASSTGPTAVVVTNITPLYLKISLDAVTASSDGAPVYYFSVERQNATTKALAQKRTSSVKVGEKTPTFKFMGVQGIPAAPTNVVVQLNDTGEMANVPNDKENPWKRIEGYTADLKYDVGKSGKTWHDLRVGGVVDINGEKYRVVAISKDEVILASTSNDKKFTIKLNAAST